MNVAKRESLSTKQLSTLMLLARFRFITAPLLMREGLFVSPSSVTKHLGTLYTLGLTGRRYESSYKLAHKPAVYYLTPAGAQLLMSRGVKLDESYVSSLYSVRRLSDEFLSHCLKVYELLSVLRFLYGEALSVTTKTELKLYNNIPTPLPDAYLRLNLDDFSKHYFIEYVDANTKLFVVLRRLKRYIDQSETSKLVSDTIYFPAIIYVFESGAMMQQFRKKSRSIRETASRDFSVSCISFTSLMATQESWELAFLSLDPSDEATALLSAL